MKTTMNAMELIKVAEGLKNLSEELIVHLAGICGRCHDCSYCDRFEEYDEIIVPDYHLEEAGIPAVTGNVSSNQGSAITYAQNAVSYFPEFCYETYWRLLERVSGGSNARFEFKKNNYSTYKNRTHFTPIWMPDEAYTVNTWLIDAWTPDGMLSMNLTDTLTIKGNLWQDWHIAPLNP